MGFLRPDWAQLHQETSLRPWSPILAFFSLLYGMGVKLRSSGYQRKLFREKSLPGFVLSIGNLTAGGTGKTPAVAMLAKWARSEGYRVAILSRGYGGESPSGVLEVSDDKTIKANPQETGDEAYLLARKLPGIPIVISRKRLSAGLFALENFGTNFFLLDDGFQHLALKRDLNLVLIDASIPFGNGRLLPWGPLREPVGRLVRAHGIVLTRFVGRSENYRTLSFLSAQFPSIPVYKADHLPVKLVFPQLNEVREPGFLAGKRVLGFAGIARPDALKETLIKLGANVVWFKGYRDHYPFKRDEIQALIHMKDKLNAEYLLTSEKDWVRMIPFCPTCSDLAYLAIEFELISNQAAFYGMIRRAANRKI
ncbi:MAG: tetraacyldisaccharide 4'-kinase [Desulfatiglandaceae bacterium]